jgi:hypothetical protein
MMIQNSLSLGNLIALMTKMILAYNNWVRYCHKFHYLNSKATAQQLVMTGVRDVHADYSHLSYMKMMPETGTVEELCSQNQK